ncbi:hypothetical protein AK88_05549 [Plasmodium fragile]|uniref:Uncharacterized protein n=1 Tax=Plasmodium fragile TaxID=5857 RepID=A0A0D9QCT7_PLAFR|nr:uncharacterized protein AK88_05549 [Plasmodium fragile]KJP84823.1 hypothetical protein AK88_05549 [Plasmodium fragile]
MGRKAWLKLILVFSVLYSFLISPVAQGLVNAAVMSLGPPVGVWIGMGTYGAFILIPIIYLCVLLRFCRSKTGKCLLDKIWKKKEKEEAPTETKNNEGEVNKKPETLGKQNIPGKPEVPNKQEASGILEVPKKPEVPEKHEAPGTAGESEKLEAPKKPEVPKKQEASGILEVPKKTEVPEKQGASAKLDAPKKPEAPKKQETPKKQEAAEKQKAPGKLKLPWSLKLPKKP